MITKQTTLILGAGASAPFGFPTGYGLLQQVLSLIDRTQRQIPNELLERFQPEHIDAFREALLRSGKTSVDSFLEHRLDFIEIGKMAIAMVLIPYENEQTLFKRDGNSWYEYLFNSLNATFDDFEKNKLSVLTFNYDRSLEHYLFTALKNSYKKHPSECVKRLKTVPIVHLHGDLGELPCLSDQAARFYESKISTHTLKIAAERIQIVHEGDRDQLSFLRARKILKESEVICFLGFGYHPLNMQRLGFDKRGLNYVYPNVKFINGSSFGLTYMECNHINSQWGLNLRMMNNLNFRAFDVLTFLREMGILQNYQ